MIVDVLNKLALIVPVLLTIGAGWKYLPFVRKVTNEVIPILNAFVAFLLAFGGGTGTAHAGLLSDIGNVLNIPGQIVVSFLLSYLTSAIHDKFLKGLEPPSPAKALPVPPTGTGA